jgi:hypothetical protein
MAQPECHTTAGGRQHGSQKRQAESQARGRKSDKRRNAPQPKWYTVEKLVDRKALGQTSSLADTGEDGEDGAPAEDVLHEYKVRWSEPYNFPTYDLWVKEGDIEGPLKDHFNGVRTTGFRSGQWKARAPQGRHPSSGALYQQSSRMRAFMTQQSTLQNTSTTTRSGTSTADLGTTSTLQPSAAPTVLTSEPPTSAHDDAAISGAAQTVVCRVTLFVDCGVSVTAVCAYCLLL